MSEKRTFILSHNLARRNAMKAVADAPDGYCVEVKPRTRSLEQNSKLWACLDDIAKQVDWYGKKLDREDWKHVFTTSLRKLQVVPNLDGSGFVALGLSTSKMGVREMSELIELVHAFGAERGVRWSEQEEVAA